MQRIIRTREATRSIGIPNNLKMSMVETRFKLDYNEEHADDTTIRRIGF